MHCLSNGNVAVWQYLLVMAGNSGSAVPRRGVSDDMMRGEELRHSNEVMMNQADRERLDALAEAASGPGLFKKKETEWIKLNKYQEWVLSVKDKFTISAIVSALIADGVG